MQQHVASKPERKSLLERMKKLEFNLIYLWQDIPSVLP
jgi:hypothetical protein